VTHNQRLRIEDPQRAFKGNRKLQFKDLIPISTLQCDRLFVPGPLSFSLTIDLLLSLAGFAPVQKNLWGLMLVQFICLEDLIFIKINTIAHT